MFNFAPFRFPYMDDGCPFQTGFNHRLVREHMFKNELPWEICEESKPPSLLSLGALK